MSLKHVVEIDQTMVSDDAKRLFGEHEFAVKVIDQHFFGQNGAVEDEFLVSSSSSDSGLGPFQSHAAELVTFPDRPQVFLPIVKPFKRIFKILKNV